ncbi:MAG: hypothetical protein Q7S00_07510, partial [bacterium]|nr:hypothetical protein [bacterium]
YVQVKPGTYSIPPGHQPPTLEEFRAYLTSAGILKEGTSELTQEEWQIVHKSGIWISRAEDGRYFPVIAAFKPEMCSFDQTKGKEVGELLDIALSEETALFMVRELGFTTDQLTVQEGQFRGQFLCTSAKPDPEGKKYYRLQSPPKILDCIAALQKTISETEGDWADVDGTKISKAVLIKMKEGLENLAKGKGSLEEFFELMNAAMPFAVGITFSGVIIAVLYFLLRITPKLGPGVQRLLGKSQGVVNYEEERTQKDFEKRNRDFLKEFSTDLTKAVENDTEDPAVGRDKEIRRIVRVLTRNDNDPSSREINSAMLRGGSGVGKTAVAESLAWKISKGLIP